MVGRPAAVEEDRLAGIVAVEALDEGAGAAGDWWDRRRRMAPT